MIVLGCDKNDKQAPPPTIPVVATAAVGSFPVFIILSRQRTTIKIFVYEKKGFSIFYRRLDEGSFQLPPIVGDNVSYKMTSEQMMYMLCGMTLEDGGYVKAEKHKSILIPGLETALIGLH